MSLSRCVVSLCASVATITTVASAQSFQGIESPWSYSVDGQMVPLKVDTEHIACFQSGVLSTQLAAKALVKHELNGETLVPSGVSGWMYAELMSAISSPAEIARLTRTIAADDSIDFVSPVFLAGTRELPWVVTRDIIVSFDSSISQMDAESFLNQRVPGGIIERDLAGMAGMYLLETDLSHAFEVMDLVASLESCPEVQFAQTDAIWWTMPAYVPNDPNFESLWGLQQANDQDMDAPEAWDITKGDPSILVAVMDDGLDQDHPDMNQVPGLDLTGNGTGGNHYSVCDGHGTCVASCVSAIIDNDLYIVGVAPECRSMGVKIFNAIEFFGFCLGFLESQDSWTINGINQSADAGVQVTNSSWGGGGASSGVNAAFNATRAAGVLHFAAAGNDGSSNISWPASHSTVLAISALQSSGNIASFSTTGNGLFASAPGAGILCLDAVGGEGFGGGDTINVDGTSFASPYAAGVAAMVLARDPELTPDEVENILSETAVDRGSSGYDTTYGWGFLNVGNAVEAVEGEKPCVGDTDGDGSVNVNDILSLIGAYGDCAGCVEDLDGDGVVNVNDVLILLSVYGPCP